MSIFKLIATSAFGLEAIVARELRDLGVEHTDTHNGYVRFEGDLTTIARANLWLRTADRVLIEVGRFHAVTFDELFEQTKALPWQDLLPRDATFPVKGKSVKSTLSSVPACQSIVKKAIVDKLGTAYGLQILPETGPTWQIEVALLQDEVTLTIDTSGAGLHKRGYRRLTAAAPLRETLAAALVLISRWQPHRPFADPLCGSGTIPIEAALIGRNMAPGLKRSFSCEDWPWMSNAVFQTAREEAHAAIRLDVECDIRGSDYDKEVLSLAGFHMRQAGVGDIVRLKQADVYDFQPASEYGCVVTNPPYGERLGEVKEVETLYRNLGKVFGREETWSFFIITSHPSFERLFGKQADKRRKLYNGRIQTQLFQYLGPLPPRKRDVD